MALDENGGQEEASRDPEPEAADPAGEEQGEALPPEWESQAPEGGTGDGPEISNGTGEEGEEDGPEGQAGGEMDGLKVVIDIQRDRANVGVIREGADVHLELLLDGDPLVIADELPGIIERALERWESAPMRPAYKAPGKQPASRPAGQGARKGRGKNAEPAKEEAETAQPGLEEPQTMMNRLF